MENTVKPQISVQNFSFKYSLRTEYAVKGISLYINQGEFITLCGKSGCGKTTLLRNLKPSLVPSGTHDGEILLRGIPIDTLSVAEQAQEIGFVMQNPDNQIVTDKVWHELAFGLENLGLPQSEIRTRVSEMTAFFGIQSWFNKNISSLSGGQKQILSLASVMLLQPSVLILDEPTAQLDPVSSSDFLTILKKINQDLGITVILSEHRLEEVLPLSDRVIVMENGMITVDCAPCEISGQLSRTQRDMFAAMPAPIQIHAAVKSELPCPVTIRDGRIWLEKVTCEAAPDLSKIPCDITPDTTEPAIELRSVWFKYQKDAPDVINGMNLRINKGELFAITGGNGSGKTTALSLMVGLLKPYRGEVRIFENKSDNNGGVIGMLPQNPQTLFVKSTVESDLAEVLNGTNLSDAEKSERMAYAVEVCGLQDLLSFHPYDLSGGEAQRAALAKVLMLKPMILLLDEPTNGIDAHFKIKLAEILKHLQAQGVTIVMVSHDIEFCAEYADRCAMFFNGEVTSLGTPRVFFGGNSFYTTAANRMARSTIKPAVLTSDIIAALGGTPNDFNAKSAPVSAYDSKTNIDNSSLSTDKTASIPDNHDKAKTAKHTGLSKSSIIAAVISLFAIPLTIFMGIRLFDDRKYYFISLLIILEIMLPFGLIFEGRKPKARELVIISVLCAIAVAGRSIFFFSPQFKPALAIIIISGVCFGGETGFLVGAITAFVSNMFFGQGPWTPWQMFAFGIVGYFAGILFKEGRLPMSRLPLCIYGGLSALILYGGIMNFSSIVTARAEPTLSAFVSCTLTGLSFDSIHALATVIFLWLLSVPMLEKLDRIKIKYGLI